jgi:hypothetical protein
MIRRFHALLATSQQAVFAQPRVVIGAGGILLVGLSELVLAVLVRG